MGLTGHIPAVTEITPESSSEIRYTYDGYADGQRQDSVSAV